MDENQRKTPQEIGQDDFPLVTILVAVYNSSDYLHDCIDSLLGQTYTNLEIICVDDASTDESLSIMQDYQKKDARVKVLRLERNQGQAVARNHGLETATGGWIATVDSDDWLEPDTLEVMLKAMRDNNVDIVGCGAFFDFPTRSKIVSYVKSDCILSREKALKMIISGKLRSYLWMMLFRHSVIQELFPPLSRYEDFAVCYKWFSHARSVAMLNVAKYHYIQRGDSAIHSYNLDKFLLELYIDRHNYIKAHKLINDTDNRAYTVRFMLKLAKDFSRKPISQEEKIEFVSEIRNNLITFLPVPYRYLGIKRWLRLKLLFYSVEAFVRYV
jgi:glycosyltransferase involved in cell wall biosynthesis